MTLPAEPRRWLGPFRGMSRVISIYQALTTCQGLRAPINSLNPNNNILTITPIFQMRKLKLRKTESLAQGHTAFQE